MTRDFDAIVAAAAALLDVMRSAGLMLATAESCTGGMIAMALTEAAGSSDVFERGFVTYSNAAKTECLGVPAALIAQKGAVSREVAEAMAEGAVRYSTADIGVAVTGVAGPGGGTAVKPVGLVHIAVARRSGRLLHREHRYGDIGRGAVRMATARDALALVRSVL